MTSTAENQMAMTTRIMLGNIVAIVLGIASSAVFAQMLMQGELTKAIVLFYQKEHLDDPVMYTANVTEMFVVEMEFLKITLNLVSGVFVFFLNYLLKQCMTRSPQDTGGEEKEKPSTDIDDLYKTRREIILFVVVSLGFLMWDVGYLVIGYDKPSWGLFNTISMTLIAIGGGFFIWGSFLLFMHRVSEMKTETSWTERSIMGLFASGPSIFILFFFTHLQYLAYELQMNGDKYQFYLVYRSIGTVMLPFVAFVVFVSFLDVCAFGCIPDGALTASNIQRAATRAGRALKPLRMPNAADLNDWSGARWWISIISFILSKFFFGAVFFGSALLYYNWIHHVNGPSSFHIASPEAGFNTVSANYELTVTRNAMLLMAAGSFIGRMLFVIVVDFPKFTSPPANGIKNPVQIGWSMTVRFLAHLFSLGGIVGWHYRTRDVTTFSVSDIYGIAFLIGLGNGSIFLDAIVSVLTYYRTSETPAAAYSPGYDLRLIIMFIAMIPLIIILHRFSTGALGQLGTDVDRFIDYGYYTTLLSWFIGIATVFDLVSFISHPSVTGTAICCDNSASDALAKRTDAWTRGISDATKTGIHTAGQAIGRTLRSTTGPFNPRGVARRASMVSSTKTGVEDEEAPDAGAGSSSDGDSDDQSSLKMPRSASRRWGE